MDIREEIAKSLLERVKLIHEAAEELKKEENEPLEVLFKLGVKETIEADKLIIKIKENSLEKLGSLFS